MRDNRRKASAATRPVALAPVRSIRADDKADTEAVNGCDCCAGISSSRALQEIAFAPEEFEDLTNRHGRAS